MQKRSLISSGPVELMWHAELTLCVGPTRMRHGMQGHVAELCEPTWRAGAAQVARAHGRGHASPCGCPGGATWQWGGWQVKGPRVSGPCLDSLGDNVIALNHPSLYTHPFCQFFPCGTMFSRSSFFAGHVAEPGASDMIAKRPSRGRGVHQIIDQARALKGSEVNVIDGV